jgi:type II secretion system protein C
LYIHKVLFLFKLALVLILCFVVVRTVITPQYPTGIFRPAPAGGTENVVAEQAESPDQNPTRDYSELLEQNIFGVRDISDMPERAPRVSDPQERVSFAGEELNLELLGTVCGDNAVSRAVIKNTRNNRLRMYKTGQSIAGARIVSIEQDSVILIHNGRKKRLMLSRTGANNSGTSVSEPSVADKSPAISSAASTGDRALQEGQSRITHLETVLAEADVQPYIVDGRVEGLRINNLDEIPGAKALGLKDGDIVLRVNGHRLTGKQEAFQVFKKARSQSTMNLKLLSEGTTRELSFTLH